MSSYATVTDYLVEHVSAVFNTARVQTTEGMDLVKFLTNTPTQLPAVFVSNDGFLNKETYEWSVGRRSFRFGVYFYGRKINVENTMLGLSKRIHENRQFTITGDEEVGNATYSARVTGGRYLGLDAGFDAYHVEVEIN